MCRISAETSCLHYRPEIWQLSRPLTCKHEIRNSKFFRKTHCFLLIVQYTLIKHFQRVRGIDSLAAHRGWIISLDYCPFISFTYLYMLASSRNCAIRRSVVKHLADPHVLFVVEISAVHVLITLPST